MKQMVNEINLQGHVYSVSGNGLYRGTVNNIESPVNGVDYINGSLNIATDDDGANVVPVRFNFVTEKYRSGKENASWGVLNEIEEGSKTWDAQGKDGAYKIRLTCSAGANPFVGQDGNIVDRPCINVNFAHPANNGFREDQRNSFKFDIVIVNFVNKEVEDGDDYGEIRGYVFSGFGDRIEATPVILTIHMKSGIDYFESLDASPQNPVATQVQGKIVSKTIQREQVTEGAFGEPIVNYTTSTQREWEVTWAAPETYEFGDESFMTEDELVRAMDLHQDNVAAAQARYDAKKNSSGAFTPPAQNNAPKKTFGSANDFAF